MRIVQVIALAGVGAVSLFGASGARAAMTGPTVTQQKTVGAYRLKLVIGPAAMMAMTAKSGEKTMGGKMATCHMSGVKSRSGMATKTCNHHVELHVYKAKGGAVVEGARVTITMTDSAKHMSIMVPIMTMEDPHLGMKDYHYGNNVYAGPGRYTVTAHVNGVTAIFHIRLM